MSSIPSVSTSGWVSFFTHTIPSATVETIKSIFSRSYLTKETKIAISHAKRAPHLLSEKDAINKEIAQLKEALKAYTSHILLAPNEEMRFLYKLMEDIVKRVGEQRGQFEQLRKQHLPLLTAELLVHSDDNEQALFIDKCPFLTNGQLELDNRRPEDKPLIQFAGGKTTIPLTTIRECYPDNKVAVGYLTEKFKAIASRFPQPVNDFLRALDPPPSLAHSPHQRRLMTDADRLTAFLIPKIVDAFFEKIDSLGDLSVYFDKWLGHLKDHLHRLEEVNQQQQKTRQVVNEVKALLLKETPVHLDAHTQELVESIWGPQEELQTFLQTTDAVKREDAYLRECRYRSMSFDGESVGKAALEVLSDLNWARQEIRNRASTAGFQQLHVIESLKALIASKVLLSSDAEQAKQEIWGDIDPETESNEQVLTALANRKLRFIKKEDKPLTRGNTQISSSPRKPPASTMAAWPWKLESYVPLSRDKEDELKRLCIPTWGKTYDELIKLSEFEREALFRESAYKLFVKDKVASMAAVIISKEINLVINEPFINRLVEQLKEHRELAPYVSDDTLVFQMKGLIPAFVSNTIKWALKNKAADLLCESTEVKRLLDGMLPHSLEMIHAVVLKVLVQNRSQEAASALLDSSKQAAFFEAVEKDYHAYIAKERAGWSLPHPQEKIRSLLTDIEQGLANIITTTNERVLAEAVSTYLKEPSADGENVPIYPELASFLVFKMGDIPPSIQKLQHSAIFSRFAWLFGLKPRFSKMVTSNLAPFRKSYREVVRIATKQFEKRALGEASPSYVPFCIKLPYLEKPASLEPIVERNALLTLFEQSPIGQIGKHPILTFTGSHPQELVIRFEAHAKWLNEHDTETVDAILQALGLGAFTNQFQQAALKMPLREKLVVDKTENVVSSIFTAVKAVMGIDLASSWFGKVKAYLVNVVIKQVTENQVITFIYSLMKKVLFRGALYPQDPLTTADASFLSARNIAVIKAGLPSTKSLGFTADERAKPIEIRRNDSYSVPYPELNDPFIKRLASLLSDGLHVLAPVFLNMKDTLTVYALKVTGQSARSETESVVEHLLPDNFPFVPPKQGSSDTDYQEKVHSFLKPLYSHIIDRNTFIIDHHFDEDGDLFLAVKNLFDFGTVVNFVTLKQEQQNHIYKALKAAAVGAIFNTKPVNMAKEALSKVLATNMVQRTGTTTTARIAPMQGVDWIEKLFYPLLDELEKNKSFLEARKHLRALCKEHGTKGFRLAALFSEEERIDPVTEYLLAQKDELKKLLLPILLALFPEKEEDTIYKEFATCLLQLTKNERFMGLLTREIERAVPPFYALLEALEKEKGFRKVQTKGQVEALIAYFNENLSRPPISTLLPQILLGLLPPDNVLDDFSLSLEELYKKHSHLLFTPGILFKTNFNGLNRDPEFSKLLFPILKKFHPVEVSSHQVKTIDLYEQHAEKLTEDHFRDKIKTDPAFGEALVSLIWHLLSEEEKKEYLQEGHGKVKPEPEKVFEIYRAKLFEPNLHVALLLGKAVHKAPPLNEKIAEILLPPFIEDLFIKLEQHQHPLFKNLLEDIIGRLQQHFEGISNVNKNPTNALALFKNHGKSAHIILKRRQANEVTADYQNAFKRQVLQLIEKLEKSFFSEAEREKLIDVFWQNKKELFQLVGLQEILQGVFEEKKVFVDTASSLINSYLAMGMEAAAGSLTQILLDLATPARLQRLVFNLLPQVFNTIKPIILKELFKKEANRDEELREEIERYTKGKMVDAITEPLRNFARTIGPDLFTEEHLAAVKISLLEAANPPPPTQAESPVQDQPPLPAPSKHYFGLLNALGQQFLNTYFSSLAVGVINSVVKRNKETWIDEPLAKWITPIIETETPLPSLSKFLLPVLTNMLKRQTFAKKEIDEVPASDEDFKRLAPEIEKLITLFLPAENWTAWFVGFVGITPKTLSEAICKTLFDLTKHAWANENIILHTLSALTDQLENIET